MTAWHQYGISRAVKQRGVRISFSGTVKGVAMVQIIAPRLCNGVRVSRRARRWVMGGMGEGGGYMRGIWRQYRFRYNAPCS